MTVTTSAPASTTKGTPMTTTHPWHDDLLRQPVPHGSPADTPESLVTRHGQAYLRVLERTARLIDPRVHTRVNRPGQVAPTQAFSEGTGTVQIITEGGLDAPGSYAWGATAPAPAWTDGETVHVRWSDAVDWDVVKEHWVQNGNYQNWSPATAWDVLKLQGLIWHEMSHVLWTPRKDTPLVRHVTDDKLFPSFNVLEDMRIEGLFIQTYPDARPALIHLAIEYLNEGNPTSYMLTAGRPWVPAAIRDAHRAMFAAKVLQVAQDSRSTHGLLAEWCDTDPSISAPDLARLVTSGLEALVRDYVTIDPRHLRDGKSVEAEKITGRAPSNRPSGRLTVKTRPIYTMVERFHTLSRLLGDPGNGGGGHVEGDGGGHWTTGPCDGGDPGQDRGEDTDVDQKPVESWELPESDPLGNDDTDDTKDGTETDAPADGEGEGESDDAGDAGADGDAEGEGDGEADGEAGGSSQGQGESGGQGQGEADDAGSDEDGGEGFSKGGSQTPRGATPQELLDAAQDALSDALADTAADLQAETQEWVDRVSEAARSFLAGREPLAQMTDVPTSPVSPEVQALAGRIARQLNRLRNEASAEIVRHTDRGTIDPFDYEIESQRPVPDFDRVWTAFKPGREDEISVEVVIALDASSSMRRHMTRANEATWAIKRAVEQADPGNVVTVWAFNNNSEVVASAGQRAESNRMPRVAATGGTDPFGALGEAYRLLSTSTAGIKLLVMVTDGQWGWTDPMLTEYGRARAMDPNYNPPAQDAYPEDVLFDMIRKLPGTGTLLVNLAKPSPSFVKTLAQEASEGASIPFGTQTHGATWAVEIQADEITVLPAVFGKLIADIQRQVLSTSVGDSRPLGNRTTTKLVPSFLDRANEHGAVQSLPGAIGTVNA